LHNNVGGQKHFLKKGYVPRPPPFFFACPLLLLGLIFRRHLAKITCPGHYRYTNVVDIHLYFIIIIHVILYVDERVESCNTIYGNFLLKLLDTTLCDKVCPWYATGRWFSRVLRFPLPIKLTTTRYNWNIVESGVKHHLYVYIYIFLE
jgi:hypothetical protein